MRHCSVMYYSLTHLCIYKFLLLPQQQSFEHSLVDELGYDGYERLRRGFDRALYHDTTTAAATRKFDLVLDAGCGTGLVGEQVRLFCACAKPSTGVKQKNTSINKSILLLFFYSPYTIL